jgi:hypothetical protein
MPAAGFFTLLVYARLAQKRETENVDSQLES